MNKIVTFLLFITPLFGLKAQIHELGIFVGGSNLIGDLGRTTYIAPNEPAFGLLYKWNKSPRHSYRFSYTQSSLSADDRDSNDPSRNQRGYAITNHIKELSAGLEFNFFDFNLHQIKRKISPYVFSGLSYIRQDGLYITNGTTQNEGKHGTLAIPATLGIKSNITPHFVLAAEIGARYTFADDIDGSFPKNNNLDYLRFGNLNNNDWYVFSGISLTYTFGNTPCYCAE